MSTLPERVAHFVSHHRRLIFALVVLMVVGSVALVAWRGKIASDVLDLLPQRFDSVRTFKTFDQEFSQARQLTFALLDESKAADLEAFAAHFADMARAEPWVERVMDRSPMETPDGIADLQRMTVPLLLNLEPADFDRAMQALEPAAIEARIRKLRAALEAGSQKAEFELEHDPLGIVGPALKPLAGSFSIEQTQPLASPDCTLRLVLVVTNQTDLGAHACQATMRQVEDLKSRALASWDGPKPEILVTGRTPYVGELSLKMRGDVVSTFLTSFITVGGLFYLGFGRLRPLVSLVHVLLLACILSVAFAAIAFRELNMITIGLCGILFGLGEDFGTMLYAYYQSWRNAGHTHREAIAAALRHHGSGVTFGALTTAAAFLALLLSECRGFEQLGVLIAVGILIAGVLMMTVFFVFLSSAPQPPRIDVVSPSGRWFVGKALAAPRAIFLATTALLVGLGIYLLTPAGRLKFDTDPKSLEPRDSRAGHATRTITRKMPAAGEPVLALLTAKDANEFHTKWSQLNAKWKALSERGQLKSVATPAPFIFAPARMVANVRQIDPQKIGAAKDALVAAIARHEFSGAAFGAAFDTLEGLLVEVIAEASDSQTPLQNAVAGIASPGPSIWSSVLPPKSSWWFILDHFFGDNANVGIAYLTPLKKITSFEEKEAFRALVEQPGIDVHLSGWTYTLADLIPWAKSKLLVLSAAMVGFNVFLLLFLYRRFFTLFILMLSLALSMVAMMATLKLCGASLNLFNVLAFPLVLGVGVDYGIYVVIAMRAADLRRELETIFKPVLLSGLTTVAGFASLITAKNPALWSLGIVCATGVAWCLFNTFFFILPAYIWRDRSRR